MSYQLTITKESLKEILNSLKENKDQTINLDFSRDSILSNPINRKIVGGFAHKNNIDLKMTAESENAAFSSKENTEMPKPTPGLPEAVEPLPLDEEEQTLADVIQNENQDEPEFAIDKDVAIEQPVGGAVANADIVEPDEVDEDEPVTQEPKSNKPSLPKFSMAFWRKYPRHVLITFVGSSLFFGVGVGLLWFIPSAEVNVTVANKPIQRELTIVAASSGSFDKERNQIALNKTEVKETVSGTSKTTGRKTVGEKAKGKVTIRNYSVVNNVSLSKGTSLKILGGDGDGLEFVTVTAASVPQGTETSSTDDEGTITISNKPGKVDVEVEAIDLGSKYNQPAAVRFAVNNQSTKSMDAVAGTDLTGGKSEDKQVVTASDQKALADQLKAKAADQGKQSLTQKIGSGQRLIDASVKAEVTKQAFDKQIDEEATDFKLDVEVMTVGYYYVDEEAKEILKSNLEKYLPDGYKLDPNTLEYQIAAAGATEDQVNLKGGVKATLLPNLGTDSLQSVLVNRSLEEVEAFFKKNESVQETDINIQPPYYRQFNKMPPRPGNIKVNFRSQ